MNTPGRRLCLTTSSAAGASVVVASTDSALAVGESLRLDGRGLGSIEIGTVGLAKMRGGRAVRVQWVAPALPARSRQRTRSDLIVEGSGFPDLTFAMEAARLETLTAVRRATLDILASAVRLGEFPSRFERD